jgi:hypothetical protein
VSTPTLRPAKRHRETYLLYPGSELSRLHSMFEMVEQNIKMLQTTIDGLRDTIGGGRFVSTRRGAIAADHLMSVKAGFAIYRAGAQRRAKEEAAAAASAEAQAHSSVSARRSQSAPKTGKPHQRASQRNRKRREA